MSKRLTRILVIAVLAGLLLMTAMVNAKNTDPITLKFYSWETPFKAQDQAVIKAFEAKNPKIKVDLQYLGDNVFDDYQKKLDLLILSGEKVDVVGLSNSRRYTNYVMRGMLMPMDSLLKSDHTDFNKVYNFNTKVNGVVYGLPGELQVYFVMLNKSHLDEAKLPVPPLNWTWGDYREYAKKLTKGQGSTKRYGSYFHTWMEYCTMGLFSTKMGYPYYKSDGSFNFDDPMFKQFLKFRYDMENVDKSQMPLIDIKTSKVTYRDQYFNEKASMIATGTWMLSEIKDQSKFPHNFVTTFAPLPRWDKNTPEGRTSADAKMWCIPKTAKYPKEAYKFIKFFTTDGMKIRNVVLASVNKPGFNNSIIKGIVSDDAKYYDVKALNRVFSNKKLVLNSPTVMPEYTDQVNTMFLEETDKYLIGGQPLDQTMENIKRRAQDIADKAKK